MICGEQFTALYLLSRSPEVVTGGLCEEALTQQRPDIHLGTLESRSTSIQPVIWRSGIPNSVFIPFATYFCGCAACGSPTVLDRWGFNYVFHRRYFLTCRSFCCHCSCHDQSSDSECTLQLRVRTGLVFYCVSPPTNPPSCILRTAWRGNMDTLLGSTHTDSWRST